jgi:transketolase
VYTDGGLGSQDGGFGPGGNHDARDHEKVPVTKYGAWTAEPAMKSHSMTLHPQTLRRKILDSSKRANVGHIGCCLCVVEILASLYGGVLRVSSPEDPDRDRFVLSKGHAALALYAVLEARGWLTEAQLDTFCGADTKLGIHPDSGLTGVDFSTGSLGHGLSFAAGSALAARLQDSTRRCFCLISDAECNEGSVWEAVSFATHHRLGNLIAIVDHNGQQALGRTRDVLDMSNLADRWQSFGWDVHEAAGHDVSALTSVLEHCRSASRKPHVVIAHTTFGKGVSFIEEGVAPSRSDLPVSPINWHYLPLSDQEYSIALAEVGDG